MDAGVVVAPSKPPCGTGPGCDTSDLGGESCASLGMGEGTLLCDTSTCLFEVSLCSGLEPPSSTVMDAGPADAGGGFFGAGGMGGGVGGMGRWRRGTGGSGGGFFGGGADGGGFFGGGFFGGDDDAGS